MIQSFPFGCSQTNHRHESAYATKYEGACFGGVGGLRSSETLAELELISLRVLGEVLRPLTLLIEFIEAPERAAKHPGVLRRGCLAVGYI